MSNSLLVTLPDVRGAMRTSGGALPAVGSAIVVAALALDVRFRPRSRSATHRTEVSR